MTFIYDPISNTLREEIFLLEAGAIYNKEILSLPSIIDPISNMPRYEPLHEFRAIMAAATHEKRQNFAALTRSRLGSDPDTLCNHVRCLRSGLFSQVICEKTWKHIVIDVSDKVGVDWEKIFGDRKWWQLETHEIENAVVAKVFQDMLDRLTPEQQVQLFVEIGEDFKDSGVEKLLLTGGVMALLAKSSGFGVYIMASLLIKGLTNALRITLPFIVYTGVSRAINVLLGPVGWAFFFGGLAFTLDQPKWKRLTLAVIYVSVIRNTPA